MAHRLLLADDSVTIQRVIELTFADEDIEVVAVGNGQQAIERIQAEPPDIILADVDMPGRDGFEVAALVKGTPELAHIPVVLLTGAFEPIDESRVSHAGCDGVLAKPFEPQLLIARVKELLKGNAASRSAGVHADRPESTAAGTSQPAAVTRSAPPSVSLDDYFDQLDAAFSNLGTVRPPVAATDEPAQVGFSTKDDGGSGADRDEEEHRRTSSPLAATPSPSLATTFSALLAAEHGEPIPPGALPSPPAAAVPLDAIVDEVTRRVLASSAGQLLREQVAAVVAETAERLVREEIERLKASIR